MSSFGFDDAAARLTAAEHAAAGEGKEEVDSENPGRDTGLGRQAASGVPRDQMTMDRNSSTRSSAGAPLLFRGQQGSDSIDLSKKKKKVG